MSDTKLLVKYTVTQDQHGRGAEIFTFKPNIIFRQDVSHLEIALSKGEMWRQEMLDAVAHAFKKALFEAESATAEFVFDTQETEKKYLQKQRDAAVKENTLLKAKIHESEQRRKFHRRHLRNSGLPAEFDWNAFPGGITDFGGMYEQVVRKMTVTGVKFFRDHGKVQPKYHTFRNITGILVADNEITEQCQDAMQAVCGDFGCTGYMMQCATQHAVCIYQEGWKKYADAMFKHRGGRP